jgi:simple sugar transport system ATP-binding protein
MSGVDGDRGIGSPLVSMVNIEKRFGTVIANRGATLEVAAGEIHALVGENGAGKSTLMHILSGLLTPDAGSVTVDGRVVTGWSTADAIRAGVGMVHQHFMLVPTLTIAENVVLGREPRRGWSLDVAGAERDATAVAERYGFPIDVRRRVSELSVGEAQRVEILKALFRGARVLILDEPTAVLSPPEVRDLWRVLRALRDARPDGGVILITHKLDEVMDVSTRITVMRHGQTVGRMDTAAATPGDIARAMVGRDVSLVRDALPAHPTTSAGDTPRLVVRDLVVEGSRRERRVNGVGFSIAAGEILGIAGVEGNGQTELVEAIAGLRPARSGSVLLDAHDVTTLPVRARAALGLAHVPEDRHRRGLVLEYSVADNLILGRQRRYASRFGLDRARIARNAMAQIARFDIRPNDPALPARALSGGNQQKIVVAREMGGNFSVLLAAQPTRGVDVGAIEFIHAQLRAARDAGKAILLVSAELSEILALADRVGVMYGGQLVAVMPRSHASIDTLGGLMTGAGTRIPISGTA